MADTETVVVTLDEVRSLTVGILRGAGVSADNAALVADVVTRAEADGSASHGLFRVPGYAASVRSGRLNGHSRPIIADLAPGLVRVDGDNGFSPPALAVGMPLLVEKTRQAGIAMLSIVNAAHFAALWPEIEPLAEQGLVALNFVNSRAFVAPAGGSTPLFGTNPMAFACPRAGGPPMVFDQASSMMARGEIMVAARDGHDVPEDAGLDLDGQPTTDPNAVLEGVQLAFGGHKGAAIAMMVELLAGGLTGGKYAWEAEAEYSGDGGPSLTGQLIIAVDPSRLSSRFPARAETLFAAMTAQDGVRLPGDRRYAMRRRTGEGGVSVPAALWAELQALPTP